MPALRTLAGKGAPRAPSRSLGSAAGAYLAGLGEAEAAFERLAAGLERRESSFLLLAMDPRLDPLRDDERFNQLLRASGFFPPEIVADVLRIGRLQPWFSPSTELAVGYLQIRLGKGA